MPAPSQVCQPEAAWAYGLQKDLSIMHVLHRSFSNDTDVSGSQ